MSQKTPIINYGFGNMHIWPDLQENHHILYMQIKTKLRVHLQVYSNKTYYPSSKCHPDNLATSVRANLHFRTLSIFVVASSLSILRLFKGCVDLKFKLIISISFVKLGSLAKQKAECILHHGQKNSPNSLAALSLYCCFYTAY